MTTIESLRKDILDMTPDELMAKIREIRSDRVTRKERPEARVARVKKSDKNFVALLAALKALPPEQRAAYMKELGL